MRYTRFPSPPACAACLRRRGRQAAVAAGRRPSPQGRRRMVLRLSITPVPEFAQQPSAKHPSDACCSLSLRERVRVGGEYSIEHGKYSISRGLLSKERGLQSAQAHGYHHAVAPRLPQKVRCDSPPSRLFEFRLDSPQRGALTEFFRLCESASSRAGASKTWTGRRAWTFGPSNGCGFTTVWPDRA